jgi:hypothetical protein
MADVTFERALELVRSLSPEEQRRLRHWLAEEELNQAEDNLSKPTAQREREMSRLVECRFQYGGQWVAMSGDRVISHGTDLRQVYAESDAAGVESPFVAYVEAENELPFGGW